MILNWFANIRKWALCPLFEISFENPPTQMLQEHFVDAKQKYRMASHKGFESYYDE